MEQKKYVLIGLLSTFEAWSKGVISHDDIKQSIILLDIPKERIIHEGTIHVDLTRLNREKPKQINGPHVFISIDGLDRAVEEGWRLFRKLLLERDQDGAVIYDQIVNHPGIAKRYLSTGAFNVFLNGEWLDTDHLRYLDE